MRSPRQKAEAISPWRFRRLERAYPNKSTEISPRHVMNFQYGLAGSNIEFRMSHDDLLTAGFRINRKPFGVIEFEANPYVILDGEKFLGAFAPIQGRLDLKARELILLQSSAAPEWARRFYENEDLRDAFAQHLWTQLYRQLKFNQVEPWMKPAIPSTLVFLRSTPDKADSIVVHGDRVLAHSTSKSEALTAYGGNLETDFQAQRLNPFVPETDRAKVLSALYFRYLTWLENPVLDQNEEIAQTLMRAESWANSRLQESVKPLP